MASMADRLILIDSFAILHRAYHALPPLTNRSGELTNAVYGYCSILLKVVADLQPKYLVAAFDTPESTFRHDLFIGYQSQRPETDQELSSQAEKVHFLVKALGIPSYEAPGFEADDVIGTLTRQALRQGNEGKSNRKTKKQNLNLEVIIVTGDKDLFQLVNEKVKLFMPVKGLSEAQLFGEKEVFEKMGIKPEQIVDYKALVGDPSDNYPGVPGIGPKGAIELLQKFKTLADIYLSLSEITSPVLAKKLADGRESAFLSQKLATVATEAPVDLKLEEAVLKDFNRPEAIEFLRELGFKSLISRIAGREEKKEERKKKKTPEESGQERLF